MAYLVDLLHSACRKIVHFGITYTSIQKIQSYVIEWALNLELSMEAEGSVGFA